MSALGKRSMPLEKMPRTLVLFDVDGTLTAPREEATKVMKDYLMALKERVVVGIVGGSDLPKQKEQMGENIVDEVDYSFSENGLVAYKAGSLIGKEVSTTMINFFLQTKLIRSVQDDFRNLLCAFVKRLLK
jgi:hydroxymethylpyrimidine pyrophosphatase-like HAD family hydrolase